MLVTQTEFDHLLVNAMCPFNRKDEVTQVVRSEREAIPSALLQIELEYRVLQTSSLEGCR